MVGFGITAPGSGITSHVIGIRIFFFLEIREYRDKAMPFLWDEGPKFVTLLESRIRNLGTKKGSAMQKYTSLRPRTKGSQTKQTVLVFTHITLKGLQ